MEIVDLPLSVDTLALNPELGQGALGAVRIGLISSQPELPRIDGRKVRSKLEWEAWTTWVPAQRFAKAWYEPFVLHLAGGNYTPDFVCKVHDEGGAPEFWFIEVKGSWKAQPSGRSSKHNLRQAAIEYAALGRFFSLMREKQGRWKLTEYGR